MKIKMLFGSLLILNVAYPCSSTQAYEEDEMSSISLEDLLNIKLSVASGSKGLTLRESPGIVSLITQEEIVNSGARDLMDVLNLVPGFSFAMDVQGVVGIAARGNWSHEGKILLMVDGQEFNELSFATLQFGNHFPVENIERIEIIRGPGSAIYGGFAEMGVIKITTKSASSLNGTEGAVSYSQMKESSGRSGVSIATANEIESGHYNANIHYSSGKRSDKNFTDFYGDTFNMEDNSDLDSLMLNFGITYKDFSARLLLDRYDMTQRDVFFVNSPYELEQSFESNFYEFKYAWKINEAWTLTPEVNLKSQKPWHSTSQAAIDLDNSDPDSYGQYFGQEVERNTFKLTADYNVNETDNIIFGMSYYEDKDNTDNLKYDNLAIFGQGLFSTHIGNFTVGGRYVDHSEAGDNFLPRLGYTNSWDDLNLKVLWSKAFRAPVIQNIIDFNDPEGLQSSIEPENTTVFEIEVGYKMNDKIYLTANLFDISIDDPIVYYFIDSDAYRNYPNVSTQGFEFESRYKDTWGYLTLSYSYYKVSENSVDQYAVRSVDSNPDDDILELVTDDELLGISPHKFTMNFSYNLDDDWSINPSLVFQSKKYAYTGVTEDEEQLVAEELDSTTLLNLNIIKKGFLSEKVDLHFGGYNLTDDDVIFVQPYYDGFHAPYPGPSRELYAKLRFSF
ncbi:TonB-dependent siderophore receptor [Aliikangiella sp. G2MR2-5]|uniref:TonB-dependent receptor plug domain-containing protein n=1 Tax=Aliikangiella sp. G2MR2-5 TaxID=2788943 RepID=UPI0018A96BFB|nr:TonB-dependent receptor plug domain-containing protein [Aliikangiella sp. G2MR2-5]